MSRFFVTIAAFFGGCFSTGHEPYLPPDERPGSRVPRFPTEDRLHRYGSAQFEPPRPPAPRPIHIPGNHNYRRAPLPGLRSTRRAVRDLFRR